MQTSTTVTYLPIYTDIYNINANKHNIYIYTDIYNKYNMYIQTSTISTYRWMDI